MSQLGLKKADGDDGVDNVGHPCSQPGGEVACGGQGGEKLIQEQHGCRQEQRNADAGHGGAPPERDGGGDGNKCQDNAGKYAGDPDVPFRLQASEVPGVCRAGLDEFLEGRGSLCIHADVG